MHDLSSLTVHIVLISKYSVLRTEVDTARSNLGYDNHHVTTEHASVPYLALGLIEVGTSSKGQLIDRNQT